MITLSTEDQFESIKKSTSEALGQVFPIVGKKQTLRLKKHWFEDKLTSDDYERQKKVKMQGGTWAVPVYGELELVDNATGHVVDRNPKIKLMSIPKITPRYSYIVRGNEYQVSNQLRRMPGVFTFRKQTGDQYKSVFNLAKGRNFDINFDPKTLKYTMKIGQANPPLYPVMRALGIGDHDLEKAWGSEILTANKKKDYDKDVVRVAELFTGKKANLDSAPGALNDYFKGTKLNPEITELLLGEKHDAVDPRLLVASTKKLLQVYKGAVKPDDAESLIYKNVHGIEDYIKEKFSKNVMPIQNKIKRNVDSRDKISEIVNTSLLNSQIESFFLSDERSNTPEQYNPLHMLGSHYKVSIMGPGGVTSAHMITPEMREVHPSHIGFLDPIHTPECYDKDTEVFTHSGWKKWSEVGFNDSFACLINGALEFHQPTAIHKSFYSGKMLGANTGKIDYLVTPNHRMYVRPMNSNPDAWRIELAEEIKGRPRTFRTTHEPYAGDPFSRFKLTQVNGSNSRKNVKDIDISDWCEFMGWFLSEGCTYQNLKTHVYYTRISQNKKVNRNKCQRLEALLKRLPFAWSINGKKDCYVIGAKQLCNQLKDQGYCDTKFIPEELFSAPLHARQMLFETLMLGDGRVNSKRATGVKYNQQVYCTTSKQLAIDFERLAIGLGYSTVTKVYEDRREERYLDVYEIRILQRTIRSARNRDHRRGNRSNYYEIKYDGMVYCATVPGGLLLVRRKGSVPTWLGNSEKVGATLHFPYAVYKDKNKLLTMAFDPKAGKKIFQTPLDLYNKKVAFPDQAKFDNEKFKGFVNPKVKVQYRGDLMEVAHKDVDAILPSTKSLFSFSTNMIPFLKNNQANRATFASKQIEQAVPLVREYRNSPLVKTLASKSGITFDEALGWDFSHRAPEDGVVSKITPDAMYVKSKSGTHKINLYNNFPLNQTTMINSENPYVVVGTKVKKGQLLADTNYTKDGRLALGSNLKTAYMVWPGATFEDGIAITQTAAKKLTSEHSYRYEHAKNDDIRMNLKQFKLEFPTQLSKENSEKLDEHGVIKKGQIVKPGEIIVASLKNRIPTPEEAALFKQHRSLKQPFANASVTYNNEFDGVVTDVLNTDKGTKVVIKTVEPARVGDKLSGLHGNKGIISTIVQDHEAPRNKDGEIVDIMLNPHGVISRINIGQLYESAAGKLAHHTGKPYVVDNFDNIDHKAVIEAELKKHGLSDKEEMFDANGKSLGRIHVGRPHIIKLFKTGQSALSARGVGAGFPYDRMNMQPIRGGEEGAKSMDPLTTFSLLSHDARNIIREMSTFKSENREDFWNAFRQGKLLPVPKSPFVYNKFLNMLQGAGVEVKKDGNRLQLLPQTDIHVKEMSKGRIEEPEFLTGKDLKPRKGGYFDPHLTGGMAGTWFNHIELPEKLPNPVFEAPIKHLTGMTSSQYDGLLAGTHHVNLNNKVVAGEGHLTGGAGFEHLLKNIDVDKEIANTRAAIKTATGAKLNLAHKKLRLLKTLKENNFTPSEAYLKKLIPVLPAMFRPIYPLDDGSLNVSPVNYLYQNTHLLADAMNMPAVAKLPPHEKGTIRKELYETAAGLAGLNDNLTIKGKEVPGLIAQIAGSQPKEGFFISKTIAKRQDLTGRGTIIPSSDLSVDEIGIPEKMAWNIFEPFITQKLVRYGKTPATAKKEIEGRTDLAKKTLQDVLKERPVLYNRAPSLHKFSIMSGMPKLVQGSAIHIPHLITKGLGADFDGDAMTIHVPVMPEAVREAHQMLPSNHLIKPGTGKLMLAPSQEGALGLFILSKDAKGRALLNKIVPEDMPITSIIDATTMHTYLKSVATKYPKEYARIVQDLKNAGEEATYRYGFTLGLEDLTVPKAARDKIVGDAVARAQKLAITEKDPNKIFHEYLPANKALQAHLFNFLPKTNPLRMMVESGARGNKNQLQQILATPLILKDTKDRPILLPIRNSYVEGLPVSDYFVSLYGARKGMMDRALQTSLPGAFNKDIMASVIDTVVNKEDCGTHAGIEMDIHDNNITDRFLAKDQHGFKRNTLVNGDVLKMAERKGIKHLLVRTPLKCLQPQGVCAQCFGLDEHGKPPHIGRNVGTLSGQTITEPLTQMQMSSIHTGGMAGASVEAVGFQRVQQLFNLPEHMTGVVPLAHTGGVVKRIKEAPGGGHLVTIGDSEYHVPIGAPLLVKPGHAIAKGDPLAWGPIRPQDILKQKGIHEAQRYVVDQLRDTYKNQGADIHRKYFETIVRATTNSTNIKDAPESAPFHPGDIAPLTVVQAWNTKHPEHPMIHEPTMIGLQRLPQTRKNWMAQLGYRYAKDTIKKGASEGWETDVQSYHPIPALSHGATFGKGKEGRY